MYKLKNIATLLLVFCLVSCIPSLHGIVSKENRLTDDGIVGIWYNNSAFSNLENIHIGNQKVSSDSFIDSEVSTIWQIERASQIKFESKDPNLKKFISLDIGAPSFGPAGYKVIEQRELPNYLLTHKEWDGQDTITSYVTIELTQIGKEKYMDFKPISRGIDLVDGSFGNNIIFGHTFARYQIKNGNLFMSPLNGDHIENLIEQKRIRLKHEVLNDGIVLTASMGELRAFLEKYENDEKLFDEGETLVSR